MKRWLEAAGLAGALLAVVAAWALLPVAEWVQALSAWVAGQGIIGIAAFAAVYVVAVVMLSPTWIFTIAAGVTFGFWGFPIVVISATIGASLAFLVARYGLRHRMKELAGRHVLVDALDRTVREEGWRVVALLRLSPLVPFNLQNYAFGATSVPFVHYVIATFLGIMPGSALYVYLGILGRVAAEGNARSTPEIALLIVGLMATAIAVIVVGRKAKSVLARREIVSGKV